MTAPPFRVKGVYEYHSPHDDDLSFPNGQIITVTDEEDADWYYGEYIDDKGAKQEGLFPRNFVERYEPETPPRPMRSNRPKKEAEGPTVSSPQRVIPELPAAEPAAAEMEEDRNLSVEHEPEPAPQALKSPKPTMQPSPSLPAQKAPTEDIAPRQAPTIRSPIQSPESAEQPSRTPTIASSTPSRSMSKALTDSSQSKPAPPPVSDKPVGNSFRDRIAAFNKPAAPMAPVKPVGLGQSGGSGFVKKPFVAPPPSKNAYVPPPREPPPQKIYRREEEADVHGQDDQPVAPPIAETTEAEAEDQPKPQSLKERIALLQKQQMEQAARQAGGAIKKEKPKRPPKKRTDSDHAERPGEPAEPTVPTKVGIGESTRSRAQDMTEDEDDLSAPPAKPKAPPAIPRNIVSDGNEADQSAGGDTEDGGDVSTGRDEPDDLPNRPTRVATMDSQGYKLFGSPSEPLAAAEEGDEEDAGKGVEHKEGERETRAEEEDEDEEEEDDVDPEVRRRMEIRERMAKMSGGMGMAGMFGALPSAPPPKAAKPRAKSKTRSEAEEPREAQPPIMTPMGLPGLAMPGMQPRSKKAEEPEPDVSDDDEEGAAEAPPMPRGRPTQLEQDSVQDSADEPDKIERSEPTLNRTVSREQPPSAPVPPARGVPPPVPGSREAPTTPANSRPIPPMPSRPPKSPTSGFESDDELSSDTKNLSLKTDLNEQQGFVRGPPPPVPSSGPGPSVPVRPQGVRSPTTPHSPKSSMSLPSPKSPRAGTLPPAPPNRTSRVPPMPPPIRDQPSQSSPMPPPAPPAQPPIPRRPTGDIQMYEQPIKHQQESEEEVTEYEGDYDTDMAPGATHKDALQSHARNSSLEENFTEDEASLHHSGLPSIGPPPIPGSAAPPRAVPPPPPNQPPKQGRPSADMPRVAPPPPPPPRQEEEYEDQDDDDDEDAEHDNYDPFNYSAPPPPRAVPTAPNNRAPPPVPVSPTAQDFEHNTFPPSSSYMSPPPPPPHAPPPTQEPPPSRAPPPERLPPRQSVDIQPPMPSRRSMDTQRPAGDGGFMASEVDLSRNSVWWTQPKLPPPVFQNRIDVLYEVEEIASNQSQQSVVVKEVYVLFMDYSQTVVTAKFDAQNPARADLQQRHEPPPARLRQDQLESAHANFGARIAQMAHSKVHNVVGDGSPSALVQDVFTSLPDALPPVGSRAYGALVYANLANATVQQFDEIRAGDIVSFRNAKLQGHKGPMKQKYGYDIGKPDHVGLVVDWDGTKKKIRAWEQGRDGKKVKVESYKLSDLRSGEVKVWRVMARSWVGWGSATS
ncbi:hypothetical protein MMC25_001882 [Agyrium rufum]|nr:hypothetical protein [Agyrium rufum]